MKAAKLLISMIDTISEQRTYEMDNTRANRLYQKICDILLNGATTEQQDLIFALDNMVGIMLSNMFDDGIIAGMELTKTMETIINEPEIVYQQIMDDTNPENADYKQAKALIHKYEE